MAPTLTAQPDATTRRGRPLRILITGGGTGGHVYPGLAVAESLNLLAPGTDVRFIGTRRGIESVLVPQAGYRFYTVPASGFRGLGTRARITFLVNFQLGLWRCLLLLLLWRPRAVLGTGGYVSAPVMLAARMLRIPCVLQEQNAIPGTANRLVGRWSRRIYLGMAAAEKYFFADRCLVTGNPVRSDFLAAVTADAPAADSAADPPRSGHAEELRVLVFGGSRGARSINAAISAAADTLRGDQRLALWLQTGVDDRGLVSEAFAAWEQRARVDAYVMDMPAALRWADLAVCRAGAMTLAELAVVGKAAILVPFPHATDDHQLRNARAYAEAGAAELLEDRDCDGPLLAATIARLGADRAGMKRMAAAAGTLARPEAAEVVARDLLELLKRPVTATAVVAEDAAAAGSAEEENTRVP